MSSKLTKRERYVLKWNGPDCAANIKKTRRLCKATRGHGSVDTRLVSTVYFCRFQGWYPATDSELCRMAGIKMAGVG